MTTPPGAMLEVHDLAKTYLPAGWQRRAPVVAVDGVSFALARGQTLALVGESGSGKTTIGHCVLGLVEPSGGTVALDGAVQELPRNERFRRRVQAVFQDSSGSLIPYTGTTRCVTEARLRQVVEEWRMHRNPVVRGGPPYVATVPGGNGTR